MWFFTPPHVERQENQGGLRFKSSHGLSVFRISGVWAQQENPTSDQQSAADRFYAGGHMHPLGSDAEMNDLIAAGYGAYITEVPLITQADIDLAVAIHAALPDPHPGYLTTAEGNTAFAAIGAGTSAVATHVALGDPHVQYALESALAAVATSGSKSDVGLSNVNNTADTAKPISTLQQIALDLKLAITDPSVTNARTPTAHAHPESDVTSLVADLAGKSATGHAHAGTDVTSGTVAYARLPVGVIASTITAGDDTRLTNSRAPSGAASGSLAGTYPAPSLAAGAVGGTEVAAAIKDPVAGTAGLRTLGSGATQASAGNHTHAGGSSAVGVSTGPLRLAATVANGSAGGGWVLFPASYRVTIPAVVGDVLWWSSAILAKDGATEADLVSVVAGAPARYLSSGTTTQGANGHGGFYGDGPFGEAGFPTVMWVVTADDLSGGNVTLSPLYHDAGTRAYGHASYTSQCDVVNHGH